MVRGTRSEARLGDSSSPSAEHRARAGSLEARRASDGYPQSVSGASPTTHPRPRANAGPLVPRTVRMRSMSSPKVNSSPENGAWNSRAPSGAWTRVTDLIARHYLEKPDLAELLRIKLPDFSAVAHAALNEAAFVLRSERSYRLTTLNIEITNRCNLKCTYCPVNRDMARAKQDLEFDFFVDLLDRAPTVRTLLPFQWGEPLMHPRVIEMLREASRRGIRTFLTTNGTLLTPTMRRDLLASGLTRLTISVDGDDATHLATRGVPLPPIRERVNALRRERDVAGSSLAIDVSMVVDDSTAHGVAEFHRAWQGIADRVQAIPRMLGIADTERAGGMERRSACREPWRGLLVVLADGRATTCCFDHEGELAVGDVRTETPSAIFQGEAMRKLRRAHRDLELPETCRRCTEYAHRDVSPRFSDRSHE